MGKISSPRLRWRIMVGIGIDCDGEKISPEWAHQRVRSIAYALKGYSITEGIGVWYGKQEPTLVVEYIGEESDRDHIDTIAVRIRRHLAQEEVWVSEEPTTLTRFIKE